MIARCQMFRHRARADGNGVDLTRCRRSGRLYLEEATEDDGLPLDDSDHLIVLCSDHIGSATNPEVVPEPDCGDGWLRDQLGDLWVLDEAKSFR